MGSTGSRRLGASGHLKDPGHPLAEGGKVVRGKQKTVHDGPYAEVKDVVGGYFLVEASDVPAAQEPHRLWAT
jgi:hypothetical protein